MCVQLYFLGLTTGSRLRKKNIVAREKQKMPELCTSVNGLHLCRDKGTSKTREEENTRFMNMKVQKCKVKDKCTDAAPHVSQLMFHDLATYGSDRMQKIAAHM